MAPEYWVAISSVVFFFLLHKFGVTRLLLSSIDSRVDLIKNELDEAQRLRIEAEALLKEYQRKIHQAQQEADLIIDRAQKAHDRILSEAEVRLRENLEQRQRDAQNKIIKMKDDIIASAREEIIDISIKNVMESLKTGQLKVDNDFFVQEFANNFQKN